MPDSATEVAYEPERRPGVANLLEILAACAGGSPADLAADFGSYGSLKHAVVDAVVATVQPIRARQVELSRDPGHLRRVLADGAERVRDCTADTVRRAKQAIGLLT